MATGRHVGCVVRVLAGVLAGAMGVSEARGGPGVGVVCGEAGMPAGHGAGGVIAATSDAAAGIFAAERVTTDAPASITTLCWWGVYDDFSSVEDCSVPLPTESKASCVGATGA